MNQKMSNDAKNKVIIVTGGAEGIGYHIVDHFLSEGARAVIILDVNQTKGQETTANLSSKHGDGRVVFIKCDVTKDLEEVSKKILNEYKEIDVLVNNAGIVDEQSIRRVLAVNTIAVVEWTMKFLEHMRKDKGGRGGTILNIGSIYSYIVDPFTAFYKTSKFAIMGFTRTLGHVDNFDKFGVRVIILCPGFTYTTLAEKAVNRETQLEDFEKSTSSQEKQQPEDVAKAAIEVLKVAESGSAWKVIGGALKEIPLVADGDQLR